MAALGAALRAQPPQALLTVARGSSDHAAHYMAYLVMARLGRLVTSLPMSLITLYQSQLRVRRPGRAGVLAIGPEPRPGGADRILRRSAAHARVAFVNDPARRWRARPQWVLPLHAGAERSVAATKSFIAQLVAGARLVAGLAGRRGAAAPRSSALPAALDAALRNADWTRRARRAATTPTACS